jgi:hypothetical protein
LLSAQLADPAIKPEGHSCLRLACCPRRPGRSPVDKPAANDARSSSGSPAGKRRSRKAFTGTLARSCRTCHVAMVEGYNFDHYANITPGGPFYRGADASLDLGVAVCGGDQVVRAHTMPNSLVTFNRFWWGKKASRRARLSCFQRQKTFIGSALRPASSNARRDRVRFWSHGKASDRKRS